MNLQSLGMIGTIFVFIIVLVGIWFSIVTATTIATFMNCTGWHWWIVAITIFGALGGCGGSIISIGKD